MWKPEGSEEKTMRDLEKLRQWVMSFPRWEDESLLYIDYTGAVPGNVGLYPAGLEEVSRTEDVLGNVTVLCRYRFSLYRVSSGQEDGTINALWLMDFQNWVRDQSLRGLAPAFGDDPAKEQIRAEKGRLKNGSQTGTGVYCVELTAEFVKVYEI